MVQNQYYSTQGLKTEVQDNVRVATDLVTRELRVAVEGGILVAGPRTLTVRSPVVMAVVCNRQGAPNADIYTESGASGLDTTEVAGIAIRGDGGWTYAEASWSQLDGNDQQSARRCFDNGADTAGAADRFQRLRGMNQVFDEPPVEGDVVMLFRDTTFKVQGSVLAPGELALFRGVGDADLVEFATGIDTTFAFSFRTGGVQYTDTVTGADLADVDVVRIVAGAALRAPTAGQDDVAFGWSVNVALRNVR